MILEIWKSVPNFEGYYEVSNLGRIRRLARASGTIPGNILKPTHCASDMYERVNLSKGSRIFQTRVHLVVASAFLGNPPTPMHKVAHWDGDGHNSNLKNLRWATQSENETDKKRHGRDNHVGRKGSRFPVDTVRYIHDRYADGATINAIAASMKCDWSTVQTALRSTI